MLLDASAFFDDIKKSSKQAARLPKTQSTAMKKDRTKSCFQNKR
jgi:hypothetical protein